ncbi:uncharacterized protein TNCV_2748271 [Trichonephila clavipes]|nr:uncharacterized protein TNCV_2748271 [Trichonephila clavipes]
MSGKAQRRGSDYRRKRKRFHANQYTRKESGTLDVDCISASAKKLCIENYLDKKNNGLPPPVSQSIRRILRKINLASREVADDFMKNAAKEEVSASGSNEICVSGDGPKSGHSYEEWKLKHEPHCVKNHMGSSSKMEVDGMKEVFQRSVPQQNAKYIKYIRDGVTKTFPELQRTVPYSIEKVECVGHIQKHMGARLRKLKTINRGKKLSDGKSISGKNCLTDKLIDTITTYYGNAIRQNNSSISDMRQTIWAIYCHYRSTSSLLPSWLEKWCASAVKADRTTSKRIRYEFITVNSTTLIGLNSPPVQNFTSNVSNAISASTSIRLINTPHLRLPENIRELIRAKNRFRKLWNNTRYPPYKREVNALIRQIRSEIQDHKNRAWKNFLLTLNPEDNSLYNLHRKFSKRHVPFPPLHGPGGMAYSDFEKAEAFKNTLEVTFQENEEPYCDDKIEEVENLVDHYFDNFATCTPPLTSPSEVRGIIKKLQNRKAAGPDQIPNIAFKYFTLNALTHLTKLYNQCLIKNHFPTLWKQANVIMLAKPNQDKTYPQGYRPCEDPLGSHFENENDFESNKNQ